MEYKTEAADCFYGAASGYARGPPPTHLPCSWCALVLAKPRLVSLARS